MGNATKPRLPALLDLSYDLEDLLDFDEDDAGSGLDPLSDPTFSPLSPEDFDEDLLLGLLDDLPVMSA